MKRMMTSLSVALAISVPVAIAAQAVERFPNEAPPTRREAVRDTLHGVEIVDQYRWLEVQELAFLFWQLGIKGS